MKQEMKEENVPQKQSEPSMDLLRKKPDPDFKPEELNKQPAISKEDLNYFKKLQGRTNEIKLLIADAEVAKQNLFAQYHESAKEESRFAQQLFAKYGIDPNARISIDQETGAVNFITQ